jgi:hypothetical protein
MRFDPRKGRILQTSGESSTPGRKLSTFPADDTPNLRSDVLVDRSFARLRISGAYAADSRPMPCASGSVPKT